MDETLELIEGNAPARESVELSDVAANAKLSSVVGECLRLCAEGEARSSDPVRSVHHMACSGGTLFTKCLAAMPNTQILSEVDPLSTLHIKQSAPAFSPTDMIRQLRQATRGSNQTQLVDLFVNNLESIHKQCVSIGQRLVLRDHPHSHFCFGAHIPNRPTLRQIMLPHFHVLSVVTVRHPIDAFLSLRRNRWIQFSPGTFEEYCRRYLAFMDAYNDVPIFKYEELVADPHRIMEGVCESLQIPFFELFAEVFNQFQVTGDSGRSSSIITPRPRRPIDEDTVRKISKSSSYRRLIEKLEYADDTGD